MYATYDVCAMFERTYLTFFPVHYYNYTMDCLDVRGYPQPRFASEYGLQSLPQFQTLSNVTVKEDWSYFSPIMIHRQHHGSGKNSELRSSCVTLYACEIKI